MKYIVNFEVNGGDVYPSWLLHALFAVAPLSMLLQLLLRGYYPPRM
jgi:hypothetical protein